MNPTLAVLITYFNERELLRGTLASLFSQPEPADEILIYDDASNEPPAAETKVRVLRGSENLGPARGRNILLRESRCEYAHFHDADDLFLPGWTRRVRRALAKKPDLVITEASASCPGKWSHERLMGVEALTRGEDVVRFCIRGALVTSAAVLRREFALSLGGYRESLKQSEDFDFHVRAAAASRSTEALAEPLVVKLWRESSYSERGRREVWTSVIDSVRGLSQEIDAKYQPDLAEAAARAGSMLFKLGAREEAARAFRLAQELGPPEYGGQGAPYRWLARTLGPMAAEKVGAFYRSMLPEAVRRRARGR